MNKNVDESQVNHPSHYQSANGKECIDEMVDVYGLQATCIWCILTAHKYFFRAGKKAGNSTEQDIEKAHWYHDWVEYRKDKLGVIATTIWNHFIKFWSDKEVVVEDDKRTGN